MSSVIKCVHTHRPVQWVYRYVNSQVLVHHRQASWSDGQKKVALRDLIENKSPFRLEIVRDDDTDTYSLINGHEMHNVLCDYMTSTEFSNLAPYEKTHVRFIYVPIDICTVLKDAIDCSV